MQSQHERFERRLLSRFPELDNCGHRNFLSLRKFLDGVPEQFFDTISFEVMAKWLNERNMTNPTELQSYFSSHSVAVNSALAQLSEINRYDWHDREAEQSSDYETTRLIDQKIHPSYLRLCEAFVAPILRIPAFFSRVDRSKGTDKLDLYDIALELKDSPFRHAIGLYNQTVRNGIGHGGVEFFSDEVEYTDKKRNSHSVFFSDILRNFDDLLDASNGFALAISVFLIGKQKNGYELPVQISTEELRARTKSPFWEIEACIPSTIDSGRQLNIYARPKSRDYRKIHYSTFQSGILAERFAPGYERYFVSMRTPIALPGFASFDGGKLRDLRERDCPLENYSGVLNDNLVFYAPHLRLPAFLGPLSTLASSVSVNLPEALTATREREGRPKIAVREAKIHQNRWSAVLNARVILDADNDEMICDTLRATRRQIVSMALQRGRKNCSRFSQVRYLPLGFAKIFIYRRNFRRQRLNGFGLGKDLICTIQSKRIGRISPPDIIGSTIQEVGNYRIAWNRAWVVDTGITPLN